MSQENVSFYARRRRRVEEETESVLAKRAGKIERLLGRAIVDADFRATLFDRPGDIAEEYELDEVSIEGLKQIDRNLVNKLAISFEGRIMKEASDIIFCAVS
jgi:hypothetical protein